MISEQENDVLKAVFLADDSGAHTCFEMGEEHQGVPINRPDVRGRAWTGEDGSEEIKEQIQETFFLKAQDLNEFGSIRETLRCLVPAGTEMRQSPKEAHGGKERMNAWGILKSLYTLHPSWWLPLQVGLEGQAR